MAAEAAETVYTDPATGIRWRRVGYCCRCGECCIDGDGTPCPIYKLFRREPNGTATCTDRNHPFYLGGCNTFPVRPVDVEPFPSCTYSFEQVE